MPPSTGLKVMHTLISVSEKKGRRHKGQDQVNKKKPPSLNKEGVVKLTSFCKKKQKKKTTTL